MKVFFFFGSFLRSLIGRGSCCNYCSWWFISKLVKTFQFLEALGVEVFIVVVVLVVSVSDVRLLSILLVFSAVCVSFSGLFLVSGLIVCLYIYVFIGGVLCVVSFVSSLSFRPVISFSRFS